MIQHQPPKGINTAQHHVLPFTSLCIGARVFNMCGFNVCLSLSLSLSLLLCVCVCVCTGYSSRLLAMFPAPIALCGVRVCVCVCVSCVLSFVHLQEKYGLEDT